MTAWRVRAVGVDEFAPWLDLFRGYADFYEWPLSDDDARRVWGWIHDDRSIEAYDAVAVDDAGSEVDRPRGLIHLRSWLRPLRGTVNGYLDDLFVDARFRGRGAVDALYDFMRGLARERGWALIRWTTAEDNLRAQAVYGRNATRTTWVTYDMDTPQ
ncbi:MAG: GNAT family N-acetyltransferase [Acidimicrobiia bacterium]